MATLKEVLGDDRESAKLAEIGLVLCMMVGVLKIHNFYNDLGER